MPRRIAVTGASGRLGRAIVDAFRTRGQAVFAWSRPEYDLDDPPSSDLLFKRDRPDLVVHAAAWTDVDACARDPDLALRRNGDAAAQIADRCQRGGADFIFISTNEVFDGSRLDDLGYAESDPRSPINAYGKSKAYGEDAARLAFANADRQPLIVRTSWLFGPPGSDFPAKIISASERLRPSESLRVVADEFACPTYTLDLATAVAELAERNLRGTYHLAGSGFASRADWAERVLAIRSPQRSIERINQDEFERASRPPRWGVLDTTKAAELGIRLRSWQEALDDYLAA